MIDQRVYADLQAEVRRLREDVTELQAALGRVLLARRSPLAGETDPEVVEAWQRAWRDA